MAKRNAPRREQSLITPARRREIRRQAEAEVELEDQRLKRRLAIAGAAFVAIWIFIVFGSNLAAFVRQVPVLGNILSFFYVETTGMTVVGLFIVIYFDTLFFVIFPGELYFFVALSNGMSPVAAILAAGSGGVLGQIANYWMGRYARRKGKDRPRGARLIRFAEKANGRLGTPFLALALATPSPEVIGFAYGLGNFPARRFAAMAGVFRMLKWVILFVAFIALRQYLSIFGI